MLLFAISFLLVFASSYFLTGVIAPKKSIVGFIYLFLIAFAQIVLTFEILSLFTAINQFWVLTLNFLALFLSAYIWNKNYRPLWSLDCQTFRKRVINSFKLDKALVWLYVAFAIFIIVTVFLCLLMPLTNADAQGYHVARSVFWVLQGSLNHFDTADIRNLCLPINSEILYSWVILFTKGAFFLGFFSFVGFVLSIVSVYNIMGFLSFSTRKKLWVIFVLTSLPSVLVQPSGTETDIIIAGLLSSCIFLFWYALKNNKLTPIFMAALAYALAIGTKTTSIIAIPGVGLFLLALTIYYKNFKSLAYFLGFGLFNFLIFSAYNYVLNFIQFHDFMGSNSFMIVSKNYFGIKGTFANFIKYLFAFFDFTGLKWALYVGKDIINLRIFVLSSLGLGVIPDGIYSSRFTVNGTLLEPIMGAGALGLFVYLPGIVMGLFKPLFKPKSKRTWLLFAFSLLFIVNIFVLSCLLTYMSYSVRFIMFFIVLSSPILGYSYFRGRNIIKNAIVIFAIFYLVFVSTNLWARPFVKISKILQMDSSISNLRYRAMCTDFNKTPSLSNSACALRMVLQKKYSPKDRILIFANEADNIFMLKTLEFQGYKLDFNTIEELSNIDLSKYNVLITIKPEQRSTFVKYYDGYRNRTTYDGDTVVSTCKYGANYLLAKFNKEGLEPYKVTCKISKDFLNKEHFNFADKAGVANLLLNTHNYYEIYKR